MIHGNAGTPAVRAGLGVPRYRHKEESPMSKTTPAFTATTRGRVFTAAFLMSVSLPGHAAKVTAAADIKGCTDARISGSATLTEETSEEGIKEVKIHLKVDGLSDGKHAVHIHQTAACEPCGAAGGHHDPGPFGQTRPDSAVDDFPAPDINHPYHMGDLINIEVKNGKGSMMHTTNRITLSPGRLSILDADGSAFIIHTNEDTYCDEESELMRGCAGGSRDACGIIRAN
jgi:Cu-Zn family superoxide dismutase